VVDRIDRILLNLNHHPVCGSKEAIASFLLLPPQPPLLSRRGDGSPYDFFTAS
jgi:hypothetical protein